MTRTRRALVLHLTANPAPLTIEITPETAGELGPRLVQLVRNGHAQTVTGANGDEFAVNFSHVVTAHVESIPHQNARHYGTAT
jgi:hypothetical protein